MELSHFSFVMSEQKDLFDGHGSSWILGELALMSPITATLPFAKQDHGILRVNFEVLKGLRYAILDLICLASINAALQDTCAKQTLWCIILYKVSCKRRIHIFLFMSQKRWHKSINGLLRRPVKPS